MEVEKEKEKELANMQALLPDPVQKLSSSHSSIDIPLPKPCAIKRKVKEEERDHTPAKKTSSTHQTRTHVRIFESKHLFNTWHTIKKRA